MWRLIYSKRKFDKSEKEESKQALNGLSFSCGAQLQDADIPVQLKDILFVRTMTCEDPNFIIPPNLRIYVYTVLLLRLHGVTLNCTTLSAGAVWTSLQSRTQRRNPRLKTCVDSVLCNVMRFYTYITRFIVMIMAIDRPPACKQQEVRTGNYNLV